MTQKNIARVGLIVLLLVVIFGLVVSLMDRFQKPKQVVQSLELNPLPKSLGNPIPAVSARNIFIMDQNSKTVLYQKNGQQRVYPASTTKMMTALVVLENFELDEKVIVTRAYPIGQNIGFKPGEETTVEQLLYAMLVQSGNDAAEILAENFPGGRDTFVQAMNTKAEQIHLVDTHFLNPTGIDEEGHYSSATDLVRLADYGLRDGEFAKIVSVENAVVSSHVVSNINQLLGKIPGVLGVKTGYTEGAGQALVTLVERDGHRVLMAVLGSQDRFGETEKLIDWVYSNFVWEKLTPSN